MRLLLSILVILLAASCSKRSIPTSAAKPILLAWVPVSGASMGLHPRFVEVQIGFPYESLQAGDTVIFWDYTKTGVNFTHHRLVARHYPNWIAVGDANGGTADRPWVTPDNYICRTTGNSRTALP